MKSRTSDSDTLLSKTGLKDWNEVEWTRYVSFYGLVAAIALRDACRRSAEPRQGRRNTNLSKRDSAFGLVRFPLFIVV